MTANRKAAKKSSRNTKKTNSKRASVRSQNSRRKTATRTSSTTKKRTVAKKTTKRKSTAKKTRNVAHSTRKKTTTKKSTAKKVVKRAPAKIAKRKTPSHTAPKPRPARTSVTKVVVKEADNSQFTLLLEQMKIMQENNAALAKQVQQLQEPQTKQIIQPKGDENKEKIMNRLKDLLSGQKQEPVEEVDLPEKHDKKAPTEVVEVPTTKVQEEETPAQKLKAQEALVFEQEKKETPVFVQKEPTPIVTKEDQKENFQTTKKRGLVTMEEAQKYAEKLEDLAREINKVFVGQTAVVEGVIMALICDAHALLEGVPGLAKSLLIEVLGKTIGGTVFERIQFLPDLLPSDIIGGEIFNPKTSEFVTHKGPIFANFVLADEINRAPPKTHAAVMEAMAEKKINIANEEFILDRPFLILATQNPLENKGTYSLPEAVLDRFMFKVILDYPKRSDELKIITENSTTKNNFQKRIKVVIVKDELLEIQKKIKTVYLAPKIREYILDLIEATRGVNKDIQGVKFLKYGCGVRASIYLGIGAKARALMQGRNYVLPDDVYYVVPNIFRHRLTLNYKGKAHNISTMKIIEEILSKVTPM